MIGKFKVYDEDYAKTSQFGWYEVMKIATHEWAVIEFFRDGSAEYRTFENSKAEAIAVAKRVAKNTRTQAPHYTDHNINYYNQEAY